MSTLRESVEKFVNSHYEWTVFATGLDEAILGIDPASYRVIYSVTKAKAILVKDYAMTPDEADEHFAWDVMKSYIGERAPVWCKDAA